MPDSPLYTLHAQAPIRICDIGGWTDTWFAKYGSIFNIAVSPYAQVWRLTDTALHRGANSQTRAAGCYFAGTS